MEDNFKLICLPAGVTAKEEFLEEAGSLPFDRAMVVTSSLSLVREAREHQVNAANFDYLCHEILRQCGVEQLVQISRKTQEIIVGSILEEMLREGGLEYYKVLVNKTGYVKAMTSLMGQLGRSGSTVEEVEMAMEHWEGRPEQYSVKDRETAAVYRRYREYLKEHNIYDVEGLYRLVAVKLSERETPLQWEKLYFLGFYHFDALELEVIRELRRLCSVTVALPYEPDRPEIYGAGITSFGVLGALGRIDRRTDEPDRPEALKHLLMGLREPGFPRTAAEGQIAIWQVKDRESEIRLVLRDIKERIRQGEKAERMAVVVRRLEDYSGFRRLCDEYGIPVNLAQQADLVASPLFQYVTALLQCRMGGGRSRVEACVRFLTLPLQQLLLEVDCDCIRRQADRFYYTDVDRFLEEAVRCSGSSRLPEMLEFIREFPAGASVAECCQRLGELFPMLDLLPRAGRLYREGKIGLEAFKNLTDGAVRLRDLLETMPHDYEQGGLEHLRIPLEDFIALLKEEAANITIPLVHGNLEGISFIPATTMENADFDRVYLLGLRENEFPFLQNENWIYNDRERADLREGLGIVLPGSLEGFLDDIHFFITVCAAARESLVLTYFEDDKQGASSYLGEVAALFNDLAPEDRTRSGCLSPETALSRQELRRQLAESAALEELRDLTGKDLCLAAESDRQRENEGEESALNGRLAGESLLGAVTDRVGDRFSASKLQAYLQCPFRFLYTRIWGQEEDNPAGEDLDGLTKGSLLHRVLERFVRSHLGERGSRDKYDLWEEELRQVFDECCREMENKGEVYDGPFWRFDRNILWHYLQNWLAEELRLAEDWEFVPWAVEEDFSAGGKGHFTLRTGLGPVRIQGRIDRIDRNPRTGAYFVTDYKSSSGSAYSPKDMLNPDMQIPLYLLAVQKLHPGETVVGGGYYSLHDSSKDPAKRLKSFVFANGQASLPFSSEGVSQEDLDMLVGDAGAERSENGYLRDTAMLELYVAKRVEQMLRQMGEGAFMPTPSDGCDRFCPAADVCRHSVLSREEDEEDDNG